MSLQTKPLGRSGLSLTVLGFGGTALGNMLPHFVLLCLVLIVPFAGFLSLIRRKKVNRHGPETYAR